MQKFGRFLAIIAIAALFALPTDAPASTAGIHDWDFNFGTWHTTIHRLVKGAWIEYQGTVAVSKIWGGRANLEEIEASRPGDHLEFLAVRTYNPKTQEWALNGADGSDNTIGPPAYGRFAHERGDFYDQENVDGRMALVRQTFFDITPSSYSYEQAVSRDGGASWSPNFRAHLTRLTATSPSEGAKSVANTSHDFDFNYATWNTHITAGTKAMTGLVCVRKIWNGKALMEEIKAGSGSSGFQGLTLFLYDPQAHQWSQTYADSSDGAFNPSMVGGFANSRGLLIGQDTNGGKHVFTRDLWSNITPSGHDFEIDYSDDGGTTWHPMFVAKLTRKGPGL